MNALRLTLGAMLVLTAIVGGWEVLGPFLVAAVALTFVCLGLQGRQGEAIWMGLLIVLWIVMAIAALQGRPAACGPEDPNNCSIRR